MHSWSGIFQNEILGAAFYSWLIAQLIKFFHVLYVTRKFDLTRLVGSGGMPSSHSSFVMGLSTAVGLKIGFDTPEYAIALGIALIVMYDASGVRRAVGMQASILNRIIQDFIEVKKFEEIKKLEGQRLKELVGHTPIQVFAGALLGIIMAYIMVQLS